MLGSDPPPPPLGMKGSPSPNPPPGTATKEGEGGVGQMGFRAIPPPRKAIFFPPWRGYSSTCCESRLSTAPSHNIGTHSYFV